MIGSYEDQRRLEREKKERQQKERKLRATLIAKQMAKDNPDWKYSLQADYDRNYLTHVNGTRVSVSCHYPYRKITASYCTPGYDFSGGPALNFSVDGDRNVTDAAKSLAKRILPAALERYAHHLDKKVAAENADRDYRALLEHYARICEAQIKPDDLRRYVENRRCNLPILPRDPNNANRVRAEIDISTGRYNKITIDDLTHEQAQNLIFKIREIFNT